jgi:hypothetical protein
MLNAELHKLCSSIIRVMTSRRMGLAGYITRIMEDNSYTILVER